MLDEISPRRNMRLYRMWVEQGGRCGICDTEIDPDEITFPALVNVDHIVPRSMGGSDSVHNLQLAHTPCNTEKGSQEDFRLNAPAPRRNKSVPRQRPGDVRFVAEGLDQGARVVYEPRRADDVEPWVADTRYGAHVPINGKRFREADVVTAQQFDLKWKMRKRS